MPTPRMAGSDLGLGLTSGLMASQRDQLIDQVIARDAIRDLVARYNSYSDSGRLEQLFELFTSGAVMETQDRSGQFTRYDGLDEVKQIFTGARERIQSQPDPATAGYIRHFTATHQIDLVDDEHAAGRLYFAVLMAHGLDHWGRYVDRYLRDGDRWRFEHRKVYVDGRTEGSWFAA
jgi:SnoaL-like domain